MLENLNQLAKEAKERSDSYDKKEFMFSHEFKLRFKEIFPDFNIEFYNYTSVVKTPTNLLILIPNQWFVIASFFNSYLSSLKTYKSVVNELNIDKLIITTIRETKTIDVETEKKIDAKFQDVNDLNYFKKFLSDYDWWHGSKTIDRGDYFVSSVLNLASVVNNTQSYIADIAYLLSGHQDLIDLLEDDYRSHLIESSLEAINNDTAIIIENRVLRRIIFDSFKYIIQTYGAHKVLLDYEIKDSLIETRPYQGLMLPSYFGFEIIVGLFENSQDVESLKSSGTARFIDESLNVLDNEFSYFTTQWNATGVRGLSLLNFNKYLSAVSGNTLEIIKTGEDYQLISKNISPLTKAENIIYYGSPGTGKSHKVNYLLRGKEGFYERITFHPEYDNSSFVGGYRPVSEAFEYKNAAGEMVVKDEVKYKFVPQAFANIYTKAWNDQDNQYYLVIEEINRGNCAEIFGDIFQLLDRNSNYTVSPSNELKEFLNIALANKDGINNGLKLPPNLSILATMNTSDQSLFPMDSAFKRRWDWEYIPICYDDIPENESFGYSVIVDDTHSFKWIDFIKNVNAVIKTNPNLGMDKCIGNYFIKSDSKEIKLKEFVNKAIFYLWNDVFKDEDSTDSIFEKGTTYEDFFPIETNGKDEILKVLKAINIDSTIV